MARFTLARFRRVRFFAVLFGAFLFTFGSAQAEDLFPAEQPIEAAIDHYIDAKLTAAGVAAAPAAADENLLRRTTLDLVGRIPTPAEAHAYRAATDADKRQKLVDRLMAAPSFSRHQAEEFNTLLMHGSGGNLRDYLLAAWQENRSWDRLFRELLLGDTTDTEQKGPLQFVRSRTNDTDKLTNDVSVLFFGVNVSCAKCHDHPLVHDWTQEHYYGMKSFFNRTFENGGFVGERDYGVVDYKTTAGESRTAALMFLTGEKLTEPAATEPTDAEKKEEKKQLEELKKNKQPPPAPKFSRRAQLIEVGLKSDGHNFFARALVNHLWNRLYGRGLVMPVDQMHSANAASHPELLEWLARDCATHGYDVRRLIRGMVLSRAYARTSIWDSNERPRPELFAVSLLRPLSPHQYGTTLRLASMNPDQFPAELATEEFERRIAGIEGAGRGLGGLFEQPTEDFQVSVDEALLFSNNDRIERELLRDGGDALLGKLKTITDRRQAIELAYWSVYTRTPTDEEFAWLEKYLNDRSERPADAMRQILWAMLTNSECRFNY